MARKRKREEEDAVGIWPDQIDSSSHKDLLANYGEEWIEKYQQDDSGAVYDWNQSTIEEFKDIDVETLLTDPYFLNLKDTVFPGVWEDIIDLWEERKKREVNLALFLEGIGSGKCYGGNTLVFKPEGIYRIKSLMPKNAKLGFTPYKTKLLNRDKIVESTDYYVTEEPSNVIKITVQNGYEIKGTPTSKIRVIEDHVSIWKKLSEIKEGDIIPIRVNQQCFGSDDISDIVKLGPKKLNADLAYIIGAITGDGSIAKVGKRENKTTVIRISAHGGDKAILERVKKGLEDNFYYSPNIKNRRPQGADHLDYISISNQVFAKWLEALGIKGGSREKDVPDCILRASKKVQRGYLQGYFDTDGGSREKDGLIELSAVNRQRIKDVQVMLANFGIVCYTGHRVARRRSKGKIIYEADAWRIKIRGVHALKFYQEIGFHLPSKQKNKENIGKLIYRDEVPISKKWLREYKSENISRDWSPSKRARFVRKISGRDAITRSFVEDYLGYKPDFYHKDEFYFPVKEIERLKDKEYCYDFNIPEGHSFIGNGVILHNSMKASIIAWLLSYELCMHKNPQQHYGLADNSVIAIMLLSRTETQTRRVIFTYVWDRFQSQFNKDYFPVNPKFSRELRIERNRTCIYAGTSSALSALGYNAYAGIVDEANFLEVIEDSKKSGGDVYDAAEEIHNAILNRMSSRFMREGVIPGMLCMISSPLYPDSFMERKIEQLKRVGLEELKGFYRIRPTWEAKGERFFPEFYRDNEYIEVDIETLEIIKENVKRLRK